MLWSKEGSQNVGRCAIPTALRGYSLIGPLGPILFHSGVPHCVVVVSLDRGTHTVILPVALEVLMRSPGACELLKTCGCLHTYLDICGGTCYIWTSHLVKRSAWADLTTPQGGDQASPVKLLMGRPLQAPPGTALEVPAQLPVKIWGPDRGAGWHLRGVIRGPALHRIQPGADISADPHVLGLA